MTPYWKKITRETDAISETMRNFVDDVEDYDEKKDTFKDYLKKAEDAPGTAGLYKEDKRYYPYDDPAGIPTIGYGHKLTDQELKDPKWSKGITKAERETLFDEDVKKRGFGEAKRAYKDDKGWDKLPYKRKVMLAEYAFSGVKGTKLSERIKRGESNKKVLEEFLDTKLRRDAAAVGKKDKRTKAREALFKDLGKFSDTMDRHEDFMLKHGIAAITSHYGWSNSTAGAYINAELKKANKFRNEKFKNKKPAKKDLEEYFKLMTDQLRNLGLRED